MRQSQNFRANYYAALGVRGIEVTPSLEAAFSGPQDELDLDKLEKLCLWIRIPHQYRPVVWNVLLGVHSLHKSLWPECVAIRREQYTTLRRAANCVVQAFGRGRCMDEATPSKSAGESSKAAGDELTPDLIVVMAKVELTPMPYQLSNQILVHEEHLTSLANAFLSIVDVSEVDAFWLFAGFVRHLSIPLWPCVTNEPDHIPFVVRLLEDHDKGFLDNLVRQGLELERVCRPWFASFFSSVLPPQCLESLWDIVIAGGNEVLVYVAVALILASKRTWASPASNISMDVNLAFEQHIGRFVDFDAVVTTAIELWEKPILQHMTKESRKNLGYNY